MWYRRLDRSLRRGWPWLVLLLPAFPALWYVNFFPDDVDPEFPRVQRPTFSTYPPFAYRLAEAGDTIDHVAVYIASASVVLSAWGLWRHREKRPWIAALALSAAAYWHAATPGPLLDGWHGLGWRNILISQSPTGLRLGLAGVATMLAILAVWGLRGLSLRDGWRSARERGTAGLLLTAAILVGLRQVGWLDREPLGYWPRCLYLWGLLAWSLALLRFVAAVRPARTRILVIPMLVLAWLVLDFTGRGLFWYQRPLRRLREVDPGRLYISAMPTYQGLELAQDRHHFRTIINLFPEFTPERSPYFPEELRFAREHGIRYVGHPSDDPTGEAFIEQTIAVARDPSSWPILVHCHASMDRSPAWMGIYRFVLQGWTLADAFREFERHRGLRPAASVTLLYNRVLPQLTPEKWARDPTAAILKDCASGTDDPAHRIAAHRQGQRIRDRSAQTDASPTRR